MTPHTRKFLQTYICPPSCGISLHCPLWHRSHPAARQLWAGDQLSSYWGRSTRQSPCWWHWSPCRTAGRKWKHTSSYRCVQCLQGQWGEREGIGCEALFGAGEGGKAQKHPWWRCWMRGEHSRPGGFLSQHSKEPKTSHCTTLKHDTYLLSSYGTDRALKRLTYQKRFSKNLLFFFHLLAFFCTVLPDFEDTSAPRETYILSIVLVSSGTGRQQEMQPRALLQVCLQWTLSRPKHTVHFAVFINGWTCNSNLLVSIIWAIWYLHLEQVFSL